MSYAAVGYPGRSRCPSLYLGPATMSFSGLGQDPAPPAAAPSSQLDVVTVGGLVVIAVGLLALCAHCENRP